MNEAARFLVSLGAAVGVHAAVLPGLEIGAGGGAGEGGANAVSIVASNGAVDTMVARWQESPLVATLTEVASTPATEPALPETPEARGAHAMMLPGAPALPPNSEIVPRAPSSPPERVFAALPRVPTPRAAAEPAAFADLPVLRPSALVQPMALPPGPEAAIDQAMLPESSSAPERQFAAPPQPQQPQASDLRSVEDAPASALSGRGVVSMASLARLPDPVVPPVALPSIGLEPPPTPEAPSAQLPPVRTPVPPRRPERAAARHQQPAPSPTRAVPQEPSAPAPALVARGAGGGAQAGQVGGATAAGDPSARRSAMARWGAQIHARIERRAQRQRGRGSVALGLNVGADGSLVAVSIRRSSGDAAIDQAALATARASAPFPAAPQAVGGGSHAFSITLTFRR